MLTVTGFSVAIRAVFLAAVHQELSVLFNVSSQVSSAQAGAEMATKQTAAVAQASMAVVLIIGPPFLAKQLGPKAFSPGCDKRVTTRCQSALEHDAIR